MKVGGSSSRVVEVLSGEPKEKTRRDEEPDDPKLKVGTAGSLTLTGSAEGEGIVGVGGGSQDVVCTAGTGNVNPKPPMSEFCFVTVVSDLEAAAAYKI